MQALTVTPQISIVKLCHGPKSAWLEYLLCSLILLSKQTIFVSKGKVLSFQGPVCPGKGFIKTFTDRAGRIGRGHSSPSFPCRVREPEIVSDLSKVT